MVEELGLGFGTDVPKTKQQLLYGHDKPSLIQERGSQTETSPRCWCQWCEHSNLLPSAIRLNIIEKGWSQPGAASRISVVKTNMIARKGGCGCVNGRSEPESRQSAASVEGPAIPFPKYLICMLQVHRRPASLHLRPHGREICLLLGNLRGTCGASYASHEHSKPACSKYFLP